MIKNICLVALTMAFLSGCVSQKNFLTQQAIHQNSRDSLETIVQSLQKERDTLRLALSYEQGGNDALFKTQERLQDRLDVLQLEIDKLGANASDTQQILYADIRRKELEVKTLQNQIEDIENIIGGNTNRLKAFEKEVNSHFLTIETDSVMARQKLGQLVIVIGEKALFRTSSTSSLIKEGKSLLDKIAETIKQYPEMQIQVVGHTDNQDVNRQSLDNWQYSALRAVSVVKYLSEEAELGPNRVIAASRSEFAPLMSNETTEGRARNRRVELIITPPVGFLEQKIQNIIH